MQFPKKNNLTQYGRDSYTKALLHFNGADGTSIFIEETGKTINKFNDAQHDTAQYKFDGSSVFLDGTGDYLTLANANGDLNIGLKDFTIEFWFKFQTIKTHVFVDFRQSTDTDVSPILLSYSGKIWFSDGTDDRISTVTTLNTDDWYHIAYVRKSGITKLYLNGVNEGVAFSDTNNYIDVTNIHIGSNYVQSAGAFAQGWMDELRISIGIARYVNNFAVPAKAFY